MNKASLHTNNITVGNLPNLPLMLALFAVYTIWGSTYLVITYAIESIPPLLMTSVRFFIAGMLLYVFLRLRGEPNPSRKQWRNAFLIGTLMMGGGQGGVAFAEQWVSSGLAALAVAVMPLWAIFIATFIERPPRRFEVIGLVMGFIGVIILNLGNDMWGEPLGAIILIFAPMCWATGSIWSRHAELPKGFMGTAAMLIGASISVFVLGAINGEQITELPTLRSTLALLYLVFFGSIVGFGAYLYLLRNASASVATSYAYVNPIFAVLLGSLIAGESITIFTVISGVFILGAVMMIVSKRVSKRA